MSRALSGGIPRNLWDRLPAMTCVADASGRIEAVNEAWAKTLGYGPDELTGRTIVDLVALRDREAVARLFGDARAETISFEARLLCKDGGERLVGLDAARSAEDDRLFAVARDLSSK